MLPYHATQLTEIMLYVQNRVIGKNYPILIINLNKQSQVKIKYMFSKCRLMTWKLKHLYFIFTKNENKKINYYVTINLIVEYTSYNTYPQTTTVIDCTVRRSQQFDIYYNNNMHAACNARVRVLQRVHIIIIMLREMRNL